MTRLADSTWKCTVEVTLRKVTTLVASVSGVIVLCVTVLLLYHMHLAALLKVFILTGCKCVYGEISLVPDRSLPPLQACLW